jgi:hypothetical protein
LTLTAMTLPVFLNELSQPRGNISPVVGQRIVNELVSLLHRIKRERNDVVLLSAGPFKSLTIGDNYTMQNWFNDSDRREEQRFLRNLDDRAPFSVGLADLGSPDLSIEYRSEGVRVEGLGLAHLLGGFAISFHQEERWCVEAIQLSRFALEEDVNGNLEVRQTSVEARHAARNHHVALNRDWLSEACRESAKNSDDLWLRRADLFPHLDFLGRIERQIRALHPAHPWFSAIVERLNELNSAVAEWKPATMAEPDYCSKVTPEGESRRKLCWFDDQDGVSRCFDLHVRFTPGAGRLHFRLDGTRVRATIAHIGEKITS